MKYILISTTFLFLLFCLSKFVFDPTHLYYELQWLDIPMHVLGGLGVFALAMAIGRYKKYKPSFLGLLMVYLCVAVTWEMYEFINDMMSSQPGNGWHDTLWDTVNGAIGGIIAYTLFSKKRK